MIAASGSSANCRASSIAATSLVSQPAVGGHPAAAGVDPQHQLARETAGTSAGTSPARLIASVPITSRARPRSSSSRIVSSSRMPPPSSQGTSTACDDRLERWPDCRAARRGRRPDRPGAGTRPPGRPSAGPSRPDRRRRRSPGRSRPAGGVRTSRREGRSPARFPRSRLLPSHTRKTRSMAQRPMACKVSAAHLFSVKPTKNQPPGSAVPKRPAGPRYRRTT